MVGAVDDAVRIGVRRRFAHVTLTIRHAVRRDTEVGDTRVRRQVT
jgi:hypothetical protein